ncbi:hypothetical protein ES319_D12G140300v1 [Gossypium barbadense]|uniref:Pectate lyase superfamily protein domain-containing protein n=2 Tax=Gossypium TaxID=3633 RepID=A0A5J5NYG4_GOSBA|nr:hypothetical protein ES319_D12G140300v1 [Gossypium barbadense]TYG41115.1 hypothetical protein ES288_D12G149100v1 [Gossypium darwinii]
MEYSCVSLLIFCMSLLCFLISTQGRWHHHHHHTKHKHHSHHDTMPEISVPPEPSTALAPEPSGPLDDENSGGSTEVFDVRKFGAIGDGVTDDTNAFKMAWDTACQVNSSSTIYVPNGFSFMIQSTIFTGPCQGGLVFQIDGTLMPPDGPEEWPKNNSKRQWLVFYRVNQMSLQGGGAIDGRGQKWWDLPCKPHKGINATTLPGPCDSPVVSDDCVSVGSGCYDVDIRNLTCGPGHGISIGSLGNHNSKACVHNVTVRDSVIKVSDNGVRIKTWQGGSGAVSGIMFGNIHMISVRNPIIIDQFSCLTKDCLNQTSAVYVSDILYEGIKGTYDTRSPPMHFGCSDSVPCTNITLSDIELLPAQGDIVLDPFCWNAYGELETLAIPPVYCLREGVPRSILDNKDMDHC